MKPAISENEKWQQIFIKLEEAICWTQRDLDRAWEIVNKPYHRIRLLSSLRFFAMMNEEDEKKPKTQLIEFEF